MFGLILLGVAWVAIIIPIILTTISDTITQFFLRRAHFLVSYWLAAFTVGSLGAIISLLQFVEWILNLIF
jgi:uncharacterized membrane protein YjjB (DUF3815 family)